MFRTRRTIVTVALAATALAALPTAASASAPAKRPAATIEVRTICASWTYFKDRPDLIPIGRVQNGEKIDVKRYSPSGLWAQASLRGSGHMKRLGWVRVADLCAKGQQAQPAQAKRYSVKIRVAGGGGGNGPFQVGGLANITVGDTEHAGQPLQLCITPAPTDRPSCRSGHTGRTIDTIAWSQPGPTKVRVAIEGGPVIVKTVQVLAG